MANSFTLLRKMSDWLRMNEHDYAQLLNFVPKNVRLAQDERTRLCPTPKLCFEKCQTGLK